MRKTPNRKAPNRKVSNRKIAGRKPVYELMRGVKGFTAANFLATQNPGGEAGVSTGFGILVLARLEALGSTNRSLFHRTNATTQGYIAVVSNANQLISYLGNGSGLTNASVASCPALVASDVGRAFVFGAFYRNDNTVRQLFNRDERGAAGFAGSYQAFSGPMLVGDDISSFPAGTGLTIFGVVAFQGLPTSLQLTAYVDATRQLRDLPDTIAGATMTHHWSVRRELLKSVDQAAAVNLVDNVTGAGADLMTRNGTALQNVTVSEEIDGRKSYGAYGFLLQHYIGTAMPGGISGAASGFHVCWYGIMWAAPGVTMLVGREPNTSTSGWRLVTLGNLTFSAVNGSGSVVNSAQRAWVTADIGIPIVIHGVHTGTAVQLYFNGVQVGADVAITGFTAYSHGTFVGIRPATATTFDIPSSLSECFGVEGGNYPLTAAEVAIHAAKVLASGRIQSISGKSEHLWDFTQDIAPTELLPSTIQDRIGTDHMTVTTIRTVTSGSKQGVTGFSDLTYYQSALNAGIAGQAAGFWVAVYMIVTSQAVANTTRDLAGRRVGSGTSGWSLNTYTTNATVSFFCANGVGSGVTSPAYTITAGDVSGAVALLVVGVHDGSNLRLYVKGAEVGSGTAITGFTTSIVTNMGLGNNNSAFNGGMPFGEPPDGVVILGFAGGHAVPTLGEITTMDTDSASANDIVAIPGKTDHLWSLKQDIVDAGGVLPIRSLDRIGTDHLQLIGSGLQVSPRTERVWSYETSPILYGATSFSNTNYYSVAGGFGGTDKGFWVCWVGSITSQSVSSATRILLAKRNGTTHGWELRTTGTNSLLSVSMGSATNSATTGTSSVATTEVGKIFVIIVTYDSSGRIRWYLRRVENGTGTNLTGNFAADSSIMTMGKRSDGSAADGVACFGFSCGDGTATLPEVQALHDSIMAKERITGIPGKTSMLVDVTLDTIANGGALPTILTDRVGSQHMSMNGTVTLASQYARPWVW